MWQQHSVVANAHVFRNHDIGSNVGTLSKFRSRSDDRRRVDARCIYRSVVETLNRPGERKVWIIDTQCRDRRIRKTRFHNDSCGLGRAG